MFVLDVDLPKMSTTMITGGLNVVCNVEIWHKRIAHMGMQTLQNMWRENAMVGLPKLKDCEMSK